MTDRTENDLPAPASEAGELDGPILHRHEESKSVNWCFTNHPSLSMELFDDGTYIMTYSDPSQELPDRVSFVTNEDEIEAFKSELTASRAESDKWERLFDEATHTLEMELLRDSFGPLESHDECVKRILGDLSKARAENERLRGALDESGACIAWFIGTYDFGEETNEKGKATLIKIGATLASPGGERPNRGTPMRTRIQIQREDHVSYAESCRRFEAQAAVPPVTCSPSFESCPLCNGWGIEPNDEFSPCRNGCPQAAELEQIDPIIKDVSDELFSSDNAESSEAKPSDR